MNKKKRICERCGSENLKARRASYPLKVGKRDIEVQRVSVRECLDCHTLMPTDVGQKKINRVRKCLWTSLEEIMFPYFNVSSM